MLGVKIPESELVVPDGSVNFGKVYVVVVNLEVDPLPPDFLQMLVVARLADDVSGLSPDVLTLVTGQLDLVPVVVRQGICALRTFGVRPLTVCTDILTQLSGKDTYSISNFIRVQN